MFVVIVGCGRVGSAIAKRMIRQGHEVSVLDENQEAHALLEHDLDQTWEDAGGRFTVGTALEVEALTEAGIDRADVAVCSTNGDNTNIVIAQLARKRFQVPKVDIFPGQSWDAANIAIEAAKRASAGGAKFDEVETARAALRDKIESLKEFVGVGGIFNYTADDHLGLDARSTFIAVVKDGDFRLYESK